LCLTALRAPRWRKSLENARKTLSTRGAETLSERLKQTMYQPELQLTLNKLLHEVTIWDFWPVCRDRRTNHKRAWLISEEFLKLHARLILPNAFFTGKLRQRRFDG
jgi:hypothetical protein